MAKTPEELEALLKLVRDEDIATLRLIERELRSLVAQKERDEARQGREDVDRELSSKQCFNVSIDPDLLALVGIHPDTPVRDDKILIRDAIARKLSD